MQVGASAAQHRAEPPVHRLVRAAKLVQLARSRAALGAIATARVRKALDGRRRRGMDRPRGHGEVQRRRAEESPPALSRQQQQVAAVDADAANLLDQVRVVTERPLTKSSSLLVNGGLSHRSFQQPAEQAVERVARRIRFDGLKQHVVRHSSGRRAEHAVARVEVLLTDRQATHDSEMAPAPIECVHMRGPSLGTHTSGALARKACVVERPLAVVCSGVNPSAVGNAALIDETGDQRVEEEFSVRQVACLLVGRCSSETQFGVAAFGSEELGA
mmetsp:Transcript_11841/g.34831  ORF Transcript_11841/g.34831 Transcript_11841/m.34831 type:complete len:273 (+) Transcript_11841:360-1178(+)